MNKIIKTLLPGMIISFISSVGLISCSKDNEPDAETETSPSLEYSGTYKGTITLNVGGQYSYDAEIECIIVEGTENTIDVTFPEYTLIGTMMGDLTLGSITIDGLEYDETKGTFSRDYGSQGLTQTMNGTTYPLNDPSSILIERDGNGNLTIVNPFTLGKMPLPLTATFVGKK